MYYSLKIKRKGDTYMYKDNIQNIKLAQDGDETAMERLIKNNSGLVWNIVKRFNGRGQELEDLYQIGTIGLIKAIKRFDISLDVQLSTYAVPYILGEIKRFIRDDGMIKVSRQTKELSIKIKQLQKEYLDKKGEEISIQELSKKLNVSKEEIAAAIESTNYVDSIYSNDNKSSDDDRMLIEKISNEKDEYNELVDKITLSQIINHLETREKEIILLRFYKGQTQSQVGKILGITQVQVSRIEKKVLEKMRTKLEVV